MNTKEKLIEKISIIKDEAILDEIMATVDLELELSSKEIKLSADQKLFIEEGLKDVEKGKIITDKQAKKMTKEWLGKR